MRNMSVKGCIAKMVATMAIGVVPCITMPAWALGPVYCTNCSNIYTQGLQLAKEAETALTTAQQLQKEIQQYENMVTQGLAMPSSMFDRIAGDIQRVQRLYEQSKALSGNLSNFDQQFRDQFGNYNDYLKQAGKNPTYMQDNYKRWQEQGADAMRVAMKASGMNVSTLADEDDMLSQLVARSQNAEGRMQAIQAGNEIAAQQVQQLQKLRELLNAQIQSQSLFYAQQIERDGRDDAFSEEFRRVRVQNSKAKEF